MSILDEIAKKQDEDKKVFCDNCTYFTSRSDYYYRDNCNIIHKKLTPQKIEYLVSKCSVYNVKNNCKYYKKAELVPLFFGIKKKIRERIYFEDLKI